MMKSFQARTAIALASSLIIISSAILPVFAAYFQDVQNNWAAAAIQQLSDQNIIGGYPDGSFKPDGKINRAEFSTVLVKALGIPYVNAGQSSFHDVPSSFWASPAIETVKTQGLVSGYPGGTFEPAKNISRAEAISVLVNAAHIPLPDENGANQILSRYSDQNLIPAWARRSVAAAIQSGLYANDPSLGNTLQPIQPASRAQIAVMVSNLREKLNLAQGGPQGQQPNNNNGPVSNNGNALQGRVTAVPADTKFAGTLSTGLSSELNHVGDTVEMSLDRALVSADGTQVIVPPGSKIVGKITTLESASRLDKPAVMDIDFNEIVTPDGRHFQISAKIDTEDGMLHGDTTKGRVLKAAGATAIGAGLGAALGTAMGPLSGGGVGRGAIYGTVLGTGAGAVAAAIQKGKPVVVTTGDKINVKLTQPLTVTYQ